jgi:hypothetical protein
LSGAAVSSVIWIVTDIFMRYRFLKNMLGTKHRFAYVWYYLGSLFYGQLNVRFVLTGTSWGNLIYLCGCAFTLNMLLFHGSAVKKVFFTVWMYCAPEVACGIFLPLFHGLTVTNGQSGVSDAALEMIELAACLTLYAMMELLSRNLYVLRQDFEDRDALYLMFIILFICQSIAMLLNLYTGIDGWKQENVFAVAIPCSLTALFGEILSVYCVVTLNRRLVERLAKQQYQMLGKHLEISKEQYCQIVKIRHDIKNHGLCLSKLLKDGNIEEAVHYLEQMKLRTEQGAPLIRTGSVFADALLNPKFRQAEEMGVELSVRLTVPDEETIAPVDLCCLLSNAFDNAAEACQRSAKAGHPAGWIQIVSRMHTNYWVFEISNSVHTPGCVRDGKFLSSKRGSVCGVGLQNIRAVVDRYGGVLDLQWGTQFTLSVMLPLTSKKPPSASTE